MQLAESRRILELAKIFRSHRRRHAREDGEAVVTFRLKRKRIVTDVAVSGYDAARSWRDVYRLLRMRTGSFYDPEAVEAARQRLIDRYQQIGYPRAQVTRHRRRSGRARSICASPSTKASR